MLERDSRNEVVVRLPAYEPAGEQLELTLDDLTRHVCLIGSTGSGKTTCLLRMLQQVLSYKPGYPELKPALLILDGKADETASRVLAMARGAGREADVQHLSGDGEFHFNLFTGLEHLASSEELADRLLLAVSAMSTENAFWAEQRRSMLEAAILLLSLDSPRADYDAAVDFLAKILLRQIKPLELLQRLEALIKTDIVTKEQEKRIRHALAMTDYWFTLDDRTRSNVKACLVPLFQALASPMAGRYFDSDGTVFDPATAVTEGKIQVISANAVQHPVLARLVFRMAKESFFDALHNRVKWQPAEHRLAVILCDEWPLVVTPRDAVHLATCRSKGGSFLVATQGLAGMDNAVGKRLRDTMLVNMNTHVLFRSTEFEVDLFAARRFGKRQARKLFRSQIDLSEAGLLTKAKLNSEHHEDVLNCPPGRLASLETHQAYVAIGSRTMPEPMWLVPDYGPAHESGAPSTKAISRVNLPEGELLRDTLEHDALMARAGYRPRYNADEVERRLSRTVETDEQIAELRRSLCCGPWSAFGLKSISNLPISWLKALNGVLPRLWQAKMSFQIMSLCQSRGRLIVAFEPSSEHLDINRLTVQLQLAVCPSVYRVGHRQKIPLHQAKCEDG